MTERVLGARRLSRDTDASTSIERQGEKIALAVQMRDGARLVKLTQDVDVSGSVSPFDRAELGPWLADPALIAQWDTLIVTKLDRLTRSVRDLDELIRWCQAHGKTLVSLSESLDLSTSTGRMMAKMIGLCAEWELERIRERNSESHEASSARGWYHGGHAVPWGYRPVRVDSHWELIPDEETRFCMVRTRRELTPAGLVREVVASVLAGQSVKAMADAAGCDHKGMTQRLRSRTLTGHVVRKGDVVRGVDGMPVRREALISDETFAALQKVLDGRRLRRVNRFDSPPLLHVAHCAHCGAVLYANQRLYKGKTYRYYRHHNGHKTVCAHKNDQVRAIDVEPQLERELLSRYGSRPVLAEIEHPATDHTAELARVDAAIGEWEEKAVTGGAAAGSVLRILDGLHAKRERLAALPQSQAWTEYVDTGRDLGDEWEAWTTAERNAYLRSMGVRVRVAKGTAPLYDWGKLESSGIKWGELMQRAESA